MKNKSNDKDDYSNLVLFIFLVIIFFMGYFLGIYNHKPYCFNAGNETITSLIYYKNNTLMSEEHLQRNLTFCNFEVKP